MEDKKQNNETKDFPYPLDTFIEESVPVLKNRFNIETGKLSTTYEIEKVKTMYIHAPKNKVRCKDNEHEWYSYDPSKWLIACKNCNIVKRIYPGSYTLKDGKLIKNPRKTQRK